MKKLLAVLVTAAFCMTSVGVFAASHSGGAPMKGVDCKDPKNKDNKDCMAKKDDMKKDTKK